MESVDLMTSTRAEVSAEFAEDKDIQLWLKMGRMAFFFCIWSAMAIPVALIYYARF
jgi:hypothetical protein